MDFKKVIKSSNAPSAIGPYSQAISINGLIFLSGQIGINPITGNLVSEDVSEQTVQVLKNIGAILQEANLDYSSVVKSTVFITDMNDFSIVNEVYSKYFFEPYPSRSCVQVAALPKGAKVEIEVICAKGNIPVERHSCNCVKE